MLVAYILLTLLIGLQWGILTQLALGKSPRKFFLLPSVWFLMEGFRYFWFCGFSWSYMGMHLAGNLFSIQLASVIGVLGLSFYVIMTNAFFLQLCHHPKKFYLWAFFALFPFVFGWVRLEFFTPLPSKNAPEQIVLLQTALLPSQKTSLQGRGAEFISPLVQWEKILHLLKALEGQKTDLIIFPESAVCLALDKPFCTLQEAETMLIKVFEKDLRAYFRPLEAPFATSFFLSEKKSFFVSHAFFIKTLSNFFHCPVVAGFDEESDEKVFNAAIFFKPGDNTYQVHRKQILLPIAESLPFSWLRPLALTYGIREFFSIGDRSDIFLAHQKLSACICSEETFPDLMRQKRKQGAEVFVNLTNDYWYPHSHLPKKHFALAAVRAVENGVYLLRACNSGVTGFIDPLGQSKILLPYDSPSTRPIAAIAHATITPYTIQTGYTRLGDWPLKIFSWLFVVFWGFSQRKLFRW